MKTNRTLSIEKEIFVALQKELAKPPRKSVSSWFEEQAMLYLRDLETNPSPKKSESIKI